MKHRQNTYRTTRHHYGNRIVFDRKGYLYFSIGDRGAQDQAQDPDKAQWEDSQDLSGWQHS